MRADILSPDDSQDRSEYLHSYHPVGIAKWGRTKQLSWQTGVALSPQKAVFDGTAAQHDARTYQVRPARCMRGGGLCSKAHVKSDESISGPAGGSKSQKTLPCRPVRIPHHFNVPIHILRSLLPLEAPFICSSSADNDNAGLPGLDRIVGFLALFSAQG